MLGLPTDGDSGMACSQRNDDTHISSLRPKDVLCGRDKETFNHVGNIKFRELIAVCVQAYMSSSKYRQKARIVLCVVKKVHSIGGRFLKNDPNTGKLIVLTPKEIRNKICHAFRDAGRKVKSRNIKSAVPTSSITNQTGDLVAPAGAHVAIKSAQTAFTVTWSSAYYHGSSSSDMCLPYHIGGQHVNRFETKTNSIDNLRFIASALKEGRKKIF